MTTVIIEARADGRSRESTLVTAGAGRETGRGVSPHFKAPRGSSEPTASGELGSSVWVDTGREEAAEFAAPTPVDTWSVPSEYQSKDDGAGQSKACDEVPLVSVTALAPSESPRGLKGVAADKGLGPEQIAEGWRPGHGRPPSPRLYGDVNTPNPFEPLVALPDSQAGGNSSDGEGGETVVGGEGGGILP